MPTLIEESDSIDKVRWKIALCTQAHPSNYAYWKPRKAFTVARVAKETKTIFEDTKAKDFLFGKKLPKITIEGKAMDKIVESIKKQFFCKTQGSASNSRQSISLQEKRPFHNQPGLQQECQNLAGQVKRLFSRTKLSFNNIASDITYR